MKHPKSLWPLSSVMTAASLLVGVASAAHADELAIPAFVACEAVPAHNDASAYSPVLASMPFGSKVTIREFFDQYDLPGSQQDHLSKRDGASSVVDSTRRLTGWAQIENDGGQRFFINSSCLVDPKLMERQKFDRPLPPAANTEVSSQRKFSDAEEGDQVAMRGAAGQAHLCRQSDGQACTDLAALEKILKANYQPDPYDAFKAFRLEGQIGEAAYPSLATPAHDLRKEPTTLFGYVLPTEQVVDARFKAISMPSSPPPAQPVPGQQAQQPDLLTKIFTAADENRFGPVDSFRMGVKTGAKIVASYQVLPPGHPLHAYLAQVGTTLALASHSPYDYRSLTFIGIKSDEINAFSLPGGVIFVTTGMIRFLRDEDELAVILGHEIGHHEWGHSIEEMKHQVGASLFKSAAGNDGSQVLDSMMPGIRDGYSVEVETEADVRGMELASRTGYDATALPRVLERMQDRAQSYGGARYPVKRVELAMVTARTLPPAFSPSEVRRPRYQAILASLDWTPPPASASGAKPKKTKHNGPA